MSDDKKTPRTPMISEEDDPADAFARVPPEFVAAAAADDDKPPPPPRQNKGGAKKKGSSAPRSPAVESLAPTPKGDDDGMDPFDAAEELVGMMDQLMGAIIAIRGHEKLAMPDGSLMIEHVLPDEKAKARMKKALARLMKSSGASLSPGAGCALTAFMCYGAPLVGLEIARASAKKST